MAKRVNPDDHDEPSEGESGVFEKLGRKLDARPEVQAAEDAVRQATEQLRNARETYHRLRDQATDELSDLRQKNFGDLVEHTLECVRKHPGPGILAALLAGLFLGRLFRR